MRVNRSRGENQSQPTRPRITDAARIALGDARGSISQEGMHLPLGHQAIDAKYVGDYSQLC
jgi:hypothetical protein